MAQGNFIPKGAASFELQFDGPPSEYYFLLLPKLTMLAFSAAVEPLRIANQVTNRELYRWFTMTEDGAPVKCSNFVTIAPDLPLGPIDKSAHAFVCSGIEPINAAGSKTLNWLQRQRAFGGVVGGICTGAVPLAQAGMLTDRKFTLHWENQPAFVEHFPDLVPTPNLFEVDAGLRTCGGGNASTDMMLDIIERDHGKELAIIVADMCIHSRSNNRQAPQKSAISIALGSRNPRLIRAMQTMQENLEEPLDILELARLCSTSRRQLERLFKKYVAMTPNQFYYDLRLSRARALLNETNMSVTEIAIATGFSGGTQLTTRFKKKFGNSPHAFRKSWGTQGE